MPLLYSVPVSLYRDVLESETERLFSVGIIPDDFLADIFDKVGIVRSSSGYDQSSDAWSFSATIEIDGELRLGLPGLDFFSILIGADPASGSHNFVFNLLIHNSAGVLSIALQDIDVTLEVTGLGFFQALVQDGLGDYTLNSSPYRPSETTPIRFYSEKGFEFNFDTSGNIHIIEPEGWSFNPFCIPALGIGFNLDNMLLRLSTGNELPATLAGLGFDPDWIGFYCESFQLIFAQGSLLGGILDDLSFTNLAIGRGGFSGEINGGPWNPVVNSAGNGFEAGNEVTALFGFPIGLRAVMIEFKENTFIANMVTAQIILPFFDEVLEIEIGFTNDGDITLGISTTDGLLVLRKPGILTIEISSLEFLEEDGEFLFKLSGKVTPEFAGINWPSFELESAIHQFGWQGASRGWVD